MTGLFSVRRAAGVGVLLLSGALAGCASETDGNVEALGGVTAALTAGGIGSGPDVCPPGYNVIEGTDGPDKLVGTAGPDCILGHGGDDVIWGGRGDDILIGGPGEDRLFGGPGRDVMRGGEGNDELFALDHGDEADGGACHDRIYGALFGRVSLSGGAGSDRILAGFRATVDGGEGTDACEGDSCEQRFYKFCRSDRHCRQDERCVQPVGICAPVSEAPADDATCDGVDDDCDGQIDEDGDCTGDVDECAAGTDNCSADATCTDTAAGFTCTCNAGYAGDGVTCTDEDECSAGTDNCSADATCTNTAGGFSCTCNTGYAGDGVTCTDEDECAQGTDNCHANAACLNTPGGFSCACDVGYAGDGVTCTDVDECAAGTDNCDLNASCGNSPGSFSCACNAGFTGDGVTCTDIDECAQGTHDCAAGAVCSNLPGSFTCSCGPGYVGDGVTCTDIDECAQGTDNCGANAICSNTAGSFSCACAAGYTGDGVTCTDIDECAQGTDNCGMNATCSNTAGGFSCACAAGYTGDGVTCTDVDECVAGTDNCGVNATCSNTLGGFTCACQIGYMGDGVTCTDIDECGAGTDSCHPTAMCQNTAGGYDCACPPYSMGNGFSGCGWPTSCLDVLSVSPGAADGLYTIDPDESGPEPERQVYCDMTTNGGGYQLVSVVRSDMGGPIVGAATCTGLSTTTACAGHLAPSQVRAGELLVMDLDTQEWLAYEGLSGDATSALRYLSQELTLDIGSDCGSSTDNVCDDTTRDPALQVAATSGFIFDQAPPLSQTWSEGGWLVQADQRLHASAMGAQHDVRARERRNGPSRMVGNGAQGLYFRPDLCSDGLRNGRETDVDCGGVCGGCGEGYACDTASDCDSGVCSAGVCSAPVASCAAILAGAPGVESGVYSVDPDAAGPVAPIAVYCDMVSDGGGWQLISTVRTELGEVIVAPGFCTDPRPATACRGQLHPAQVHPAMEVRVEAAGTDYAAIYSNFSTSANSTVRYMTLERTVTTSDMCTDGDNMCSDMAADPSLYVQGSGYSIVFQAPLVQWWRYGGWSVGAEPGSGTNYGQLSATGYTSLTYLRSRAAAQGATTLVADGMQRLWAR